MPKIEEWLSEHSEYCATCDDCDAESTRDGSQYMAGAKAIVEGFEIYDDLKIRCKDCAAKFKAAKNEQGK